MPEINPEDIQLFIYERGEVRAKDLEIAFVESGKISRATLYNWKKSLETEGKIAAKPDIRIKRFQNYVPEKYHKELEALKQRKQLQTDLAALPPEDAVEMIKSLREELKNLRREKRISELEEMPLPLNAVYDKLLESGFEEEDLLPFNDEIIYRLSLDRFFDQFTTEDVEIKLIPASEFEDPKILPAIINWRPWKLLNTTPITGIFILAAYKEALRLDKEKFEADLLRWKEEYGLSEEEWREVGPQVRDMIEDGLIPLEISNFLVAHILSKTPEGSKRLSDFRAGINKRYISRDEILKYLDLARNKNS